MRYQIKESKNLKSNSIFDLVIQLKILFKQSLIFCFISCLIFLHGSNILLAEQINWTEVANTGNKRAFIDIKSIKYNNKNMMSVLTKYSEFDPDDQIIINTNTYIMAIDCENRLYSKLSSNGELKQVKTWNKPINDKFIKKTIINSCSY